eukprot:7984274-Lingulodinium_polyedra.AAC.1
MRVPVAWQLFGFTNKGRVENTPALARRPLGSRGPLGVLRGTPCQAPGRGRNATRNAQHALNP